VSETPLHAKGKIAYRDLRLSRSKGFGLVCVGEPNLLAALEEVLDGGQPRPEAHGEPDHPRYVDALRR
jgi:hypothetical protein